MSKWGNLGKRGVATVDTRRVEGLPASLLNGMGGLDDPPTSWLYSTRRGGGPLVSLSVDARGVEGSLVSHQSM